MHRGHLAGCAVGIALALGYVALSGASAGGLGLLVAALACPLAMVVAMRFLMGGRHAGCGQAAHDHPAPATGAGRTPAGPA
ncbi:MAG TPA: hypothetical protein VFO65_09105 [Acidimicrobiales bacterium]|nr:hypothetical protein [Acidimicrobiales bacterium]